MNFENEQHLGGKLVGIGKIRTDGTMEHQFLEKPIKNKIVSTGLDHMLRYKGDNTAYYGVYNDYANWIIGALGGQEHWCPLTFSSFGTSAESTSFFDEGLKEWIGTRTSTKVSGNGLCGTKINAFGNYSFRVTHKHNAVSETTTVNEIAWFGRYGSSTYTYPMFSRVVLDTPIVLSAGEQLITTYQLDVQYAGTQEENISFFGLTDVNGQPLKAQKKLVVYQKKNTSYDWQEEISPSYIDSSGVSNSSNTAISFAHPCVVPNSYSSTGYQYTGGLFYSIGSLQLPSDGVSINPQSYSSSYEKSYYVPITSGSQISSATYDFGKLNEYNGVGRTTKYRDVTYVIGAYLPMIGASNGYKDITNFACRGYAYRFGYYDEGNNWVQQAFRKYANQELTLTFRTRFTTEDTTSED